MTERPHDFFAWRGWPVVAVVMAVIAALLVTALLLDTLGLWDRWFGGPAVTLTVPPAPGVMIEYDPAAKTIALNISFLAENRGHGNETVRSIRGSLDAAATPVLDFDTSDADCKVVEGKWPAIPVDAPPQLVLCRLSHGLPGGAAERLSAAPLVLNVNVEGKRDAKYSLRYCLTESYAFWRDFLSARKKTTRVMPTPVCG